MLADGTSHADQGGKLLFHVKVEMDLETSQVTGRHFVRLQIDRQQREATARSTYRRGNYFIQADFGEKSQNATKAQVTVHQAVRRPIGRQQRGMTPTEQNKQFDPGG